MQKARRQENGDAWTRTTVVMAVVQGGHELVPGCVRVFTDVAENAVINREFGLRCRW